MDEHQIDFAVEKAEAERDNGVLEASRKAFPDQLLTPDNYKVTECIDCGEDLIEFRMQRGCLRCVFCQAVKERRI